MHGPRTLLLASVASAWALLAGSVSSLFTSGESLGRVIEVSVAVMASGFLYLVKKWITRQEEADRKVMDTLRVATEHQRDFEARVSEFMGLVKGHLGLHGENSDPELMVRKGERRQHPDRRIICSNEQCPRLQPTLTSSKS